MSNFIKLRLILQQPKPDLGNFLVELEKEEMKKEDLDLLLRKAVESKVIQFRDFCNALVRKGANINFFDSKDHVSNLMLACEKGNYQMVEALLQFKQINLLHIDSRQLHVGFYAVENKSREDSDNILRLLLTRQPTLVNKQAGNQTLLIAAIRKGKVELVKSLLEAGADPNWQVPDTGNTSLHDAVKQLKSKLSKAMSEIIRLLLMKGGDSFRKNKQQKSVYDYAEKALPDYQKIEESVKEQLRLQQEKVIVMCQLNTQQDVDLLLGEASRLFEIYEADSDEEQTFLTESVIYLPLAEEILTFQKDCLTQYELAQKQIKGFITKLQKIVHPEGLLVQVYGSFATGLWVKQSNIDLQLVKRDPYEMHVLPPKQLIQKIYDSLKKLSQFKSVSTYNKNLRLTVIKVEIGEGHRARNIHISMSDRNQVGKAMACFINQQASLYPELRPMFFVLKALSCQFKLSQPKNGGIKTYALIIMLLSCISKWNRSDLGKLLLDFLFYFGFYYDYHYERKSDEVQPLDSYSISLQIIDPLNHSNDLGKNMRASDLQKMFRSAYIALHTNISASNRLKIMFQTKKIFLPL